ncbi:MAG: hypothetical protein ACI4KM_10260 [Oscillospiraceae bacterium]
MALDEGEKSGGEISDGDSSESYESSSQSFSGGSESSHFSSTDSELEASSDFSGEESMDSSAFSSTDVQLESAMEAGAANNSSAFESSDSELNSAFEESGENNENPSENQQEGNETAAAEMPNENSVESVNEEQSSIQPLADTEENNEFLQPHNEQLYLNDELSEMRGNPDMALEAIDKDSLRDRIERDTLMDADEDMRSQYVDITKAKGFLQEEMIKSTLNSDFEVSDTTVKSVHEDGSVTFTDIEATAKHDIEISDGVVIHEGEKLAIESKAGDERYISSQIDHINQQLEGMPEDSHRMLFVTADVNNLSAQDKERLGKVLEDNNATMNVLPYYSYDLTDTIMHMSVNGDMQSSENTEEMPAVGSDSVESGESGEQPEERISLADLFGSVFGKHEESTQTPETAAENQILQTPEDNERAEMPDEDREAIIARERERLEADTQTVQELLAENKPLKELPETERAAVINVAVAKAMEHDPSLTLDMAEEYRSRIQFAELDEVAADNHVDADYAKRIQGYYSPETGLKINVDAYGSETSETLVTITHETLHMIAQRYNENDEAIPGMTGLKRSDLPQSGRNVGMNEGTTEMYASRDMSELLPNRQESSYTREVDIMQKYEPIVGAENLHEAYMASGTMPLKEDFDTYMGSGKFDDFCRLMDRMHSSESNRDFETADNIHRELEKTLNEYAENKENFHK